MTEILKPKLEAAGWIDLVAIGVVKQVEERVTAPYIGNGTFVSGAIKGVIGGVVDGMGGRVGRIVSGALLVDAGEDLAMGVMGMAGGMFGGNSAQTDEFGK